MTLARKLLWVMPPLVSSRNFFPSRPALALARRDGSELATLDAVEHDDVGASRNGFVSLLFVPHLDIQEKRKATHFARGRDRCGNRSRTALMMMRI